MYHLEEDVDGGNLSLVEAVSVRAGGQGVYGKPLRLPLSSAVSSKLF